MVSSSTEAAPLTAAKDLLPLSEKRSVVNVFDGSDTTREIVTWMRALRSFFNLSNHPFPETNQLSLMNHNWAHELRIVRATLLRCSQIVFSSVHFEKSDHTIFDETDAAP